MQHVAIPSSNSHSSHAPADHVGGRESFRPIKNQKSKIKNEIPRLTSPTSPTSPKPPTAPTSRVPEPSTFNACSRFIGVQSSTGFALRKGLGVWELTHGPDRAILKHEMGLAYVAYLMDHPNEPIHGLALALKVRALRNGQPAESAELIQERALALDDAEAFWALRRKQLKLEALVDSEDELDPVKEEAQRELKEIYDYQKKNPWRTRDNAQRAVRAVTMAIKRFHKMLAAATDTAGSPAPVLRSFSDHIMHHILAPSGRAGAHGGLRHEVSAGRFLYETQLEVPAQNEPLDPLT